SPVREHPRRVMVEAGLAVWRSGHGTNWRSEVQDGRSARWLGILTEIVPAESRDAAGPRAQLPKPAATKGPGVRCNGHARRVSGGRKTGDDRPGSALHSSSQTEMFS